MPWADSDLDFSVIDKAQTLGELLRLLFAMMEAFGPKDVADLLSGFDPLGIDAETAGRWLRDERRPSKQHLKLIVRVLQKHGLMGTPPARDRLFIRIAVYYAKLEVPRLSPIVPSRAPIDDESRVSLPTFLTPGSRFRAMREGHELALALQGDLQSADEDMPRFNARRAKPRPPILPSRPTALERQRLTLSPQLHAIQTVSPAAPPLSPWKRLVRGLLSLLDPR